jgi:hypothetical protein
MSFPLPTNPLLTRSSISLLALLAVLVCTAGCGGSGGATAPVSTYNNLDPGILPPGVNASSQATVSKNAQALPGWQTCIGTCANAAVPQTYAMTQNIASPSLNDDATASSLSESGTPFGDVMWYYHFGDSTATHFIEDLYLWIDNPENVEALEIAVLKNDGLNWYKMESQCDYQSGEFRGFDVESFQWANLGANCVPAKANTWQRVTIQYSTVGGTTNFEGVSFDGVLQPITTSLPPESQTTSSELLGIHIQLDNANMTAGYTVYVDDLTLYSW